MFHNSYLYTKAHHNTFLTLPNIDIFFVGHSGGRVSRSIMPQIADVNVRFYQTGSKTEMGL